MLEPPQCSSKTHVRAEFQFVFRDFAGTLSEWVQALYCPVMSSHFLHSLGNYTRRAIFPEMCKINQSSLDFHCEPFGWLIDWRKVNFDLIGLLDSYRPTCFYGGGAKVTQRYGITRYIFIVNVFSEYKMTVPVESTAGIGKVHFTFCVASQSQKAPGVGLINPTQNRNSSCWLPMHLFATVHLHIHEKGVPRLLAQSLPPVWQSRLCVPRQTIARPKAIYTWPLSPLHRVVTSRELFRIFTFSDFHGPGKWSLLARSVVVVSAWWMLCCCVCLWSPNAHGALIQCTHDCIPETGPPRQLSPFFQIGSADLIKLK